MSEDKKQEATEQELTPEQLENVAGGVIATSHEIKQKLPSKDGFFDVFTELSTDSGK